MGVAPGLSLVAPARRGAYAIRVVSRPWSWMSLAASATVTATLAGPLVVGSLLAVLLTGVWITAGIPKVQRLLDAHARDREIRARRDDREARLEDAGARREGLQELTGLVDSVDDVGDADRMELERLLDHYTNVAIARARCTPLLASTDGLALEAILPHLVRGVRKSLMERRLACWKRCRDRALALQNELDATAEMIWLVLQRAALAGVDRSIALGDQLRSRQALLAPADRDGLDEET